MIPATFAFQIACIRRNLLTFYLIVAAGLGALASSDSAKPLLGKLRGYDGEIDKTKISDKRSPDKARVTLIWALSQVDGNKIERQDTDALLKWWNESHERFEQQGPRSPSNEKKP